MNIMYFYNIYIFYTNTNSIHILFENVRYEY